MLGQANQERGSIELIVMGLLAALVVVVAVPLLSSIGQKTADTLSILDQDVGGNIMSVNDDDMLGEPPQVGGN